MRSLVAKHAMSDSLTQADSQAGCNRIPYRLRCVCIYIYGKDKHDADLRFSLSLSLDGILPTSIFF